MPGEKREAVLYLQQQHELSLRRACQAVSMNRGTFYYQPVERDDREIIDSLNHLAQKHPRNGFWLLFDRLRQTGHFWNHKRVYRVYKALGMHIRRKSKKRLPNRVKSPLLECTAPNQQWSMDFMSDTLWSGRRFRILNILDEFNRELLELEVDTSLPSARVIEALERLLEWRGKPESIRVDNGPEFISHKLEQWCKEKTITLDFIRPGKPTENARVERFNGTFRRDFLDCYIFTSLREVRAMAEEWTTDYNLHRPHRSLDKLSPIQYLKRYNQAQEL